jgi:hypothetical protein
MVSRIFRQGTVYAITKIDIPSHTSYLLICNRYKSLNLFNVNLELK